MPFFPGTAVPDALPRADQTPTPPAEPDHRPQADGQGYGDLALSLPLPDFGPGEVR
ncbi:hypothetical protein ABZ502_17255 [Streptomyces abikoensis]|uniref:hypothetical protein n=1 Tax=Streptomyces abikoensis TaxID=97398 RepID=UPI0034081AD3